MIPAIAQVCTLPASFEDDIRDYAAGKCSAIEFWLTKLEQFVLEKGSDAVRKLLAENEMEAVAASYHGGLFQPDNLGFQDAWSRFQDRLRVCHDLRVPVLVVAVDTQEPLSQELLDRVAGRLKAISKAAAKAEMLVALEFQSSATFPNNLETTVALIDDVGHPALGICLDAFHFHAGPSKVDDLQLLTRENLLHVQLCDVADIPRELATDQDRILPLEGDIAIPSILKCLSAIEYRRGVSIESYNPRFWQIPPRQFGEIALTSLRKALGQTRSSPSTEGHETA